MYSAFQQSLTAFTRSAALSNESKRLEAMSKAFDDLVESANLVMANPGMFKHLKKLKQVYIDDITNAHQLLFFFERSVAFNLLYG